MKHHQRQNTSGYNSTVYEHLQESGHHFNDKDVVVLDTGLSGLKEVERGFVQDTTPQLTVWSLFPTFSHMGQGRHKGT